VLGKIKLVVFKPPVFSLILQMFVLEIDQISVIEKWINRKLTKYSACPTEEKKVITFLLRYLPSAEYQFESFPVVHLRNSVAWCFYLFYRREMRSPERKQLSFSRLPEVPHWYQIVPEE
jgi:hypothetical protein